MKNSTQNQKEKKQESRESKSMGNLRKMMDMIVSFFYPS